MEPEIDWTPVTPRESRVINNPGSWHNLSGELIRELGPNIWVVERGYVDFTGVDIGGKMTIIRLNDGGLFIHSALPLNAELKRAVDSLGDVAVIVAPNNQHVDFVTHWKKHYPSAIAIAPPGFSAKRKDIPFDGEIDVVKGHPAWNGKGVEHVYVAGAQFINETVFFHRESRTLVSTDLAFSPVEGMGFWARLTHVVMQNLFWVIYHWIIVRDRRALEGSLERIENWEFDKLVVSHGMVVTKDAKDLVKRWQRRK